MVNNCPDTPCREWQGPRLDKHDQKRAYGVCSKEGRQWLVHRWVWTLMYGPIPDGMVVMHLCDNPPCFRLDHLQLGTQAENVADREAKGRGNNRYHSTLTHCPEGHEYDEENTYVVPKSGHRQCRKCKRARDTRYRAEGRCN